MVREGPPKLPDLPKKTADRFDRGRIEVSFKVSVSLAAK